MWPGRLTPRFANVLVKSLRSRMRQLDDLAYFVQGFPKGLDAVPVLDLTHDAGLETL